MMRSGIYASKKMSRQVKEDIDQIRLGNHKYTVIEKPEQPSSEDLNGEKSTCFVVQDSHEDSFQIYNKADGKLSEKFSSVKRIGLDLFFVRRNDKNKTQELFINNEVFDYDNVKNSPEVMLMGNLDELVASSTYLEHSVLNNKGQMGN